MIEPIRYMPKKTAKGSRAMIFAFERFCIYAKNMVYRGKNSFYSANYHKIAMLIIEKQIYLNY